MMMFENIKTNARDKLPAKFFIEML